MKVKSSNLIILVLVSQMVLGSDDRITRDERFGTNQSNSTNGLYNRHNVHLSYSKMVVESNQIHLRISYFEEDLENMIRTITVKYQNSSSIPSNDSLQSDYFKASFELRHDGTVLNPVFVAKGVDGDMTWRYFVFPLPQKTSTIQFTNSFLFELFDDQKNIVSVFLADKDKYFSFYCVKNSQTYQFEL